MHKRFSKPTRFLRMLSTVLVSALMPLSLQANSEMRTWKIKDGDPIVGEIFRVDEEKKVVILRNNEGKEVDVAFDTLQNLDRAWLTEWIEMNEELSEKVGELGGRLTRHEGKGKTFTTGFHVYEPSSRVKSGEAGPLFMLFCPSGKPVRYLLRHVEAAEKANVTLVSAENFRNHIPVEEYEGRYRDIHPLIVTAVKHDPAHFYLGGTSGGALCAFRLSAKFPDIKVAGIYSNGGWLGEKSGAKLPYQKMRVGLANGDKDSAANHYNDMMTEILQERECTIGMFAFEGGHNVPPSSVQAKTFRWLLGEFQ